MCYAAYLYVVGGKKLGGARGVEGVFGVGLGMLPVNKHTINSVSVCIKYRKKSI